jgi:HEAT repeat protein
MKFAGAKAFLPLFVLFTNSANCSAVRHSAGATLGWHEESLTNASPEIRAGLVKCLNESDQRIALDAAEVLFGWSLELKLSTELMLQIFLSTNSTLAVEAGQQLSAIKNHPPGAAAVVPGVIGALPGSDPATLTRAIELLGLLGCECQVVVPALTNCLVSNSSTIRREAARALGEYAEQAGPEVLILTNALNDPDLLVRKEAKNALMKIPSYAVPVLMAQLSDGDRMTRLAAVESLKAFGAAADEALPALLEAARDSDLKDSATEALMRFPNYALPVLLEELRAVSEQPSIEFWSDPEGSHRQSETARNACMAIEALGEGARPAVPVLVAHLRAENPHVAVQVALTLGRLGLEPDVVVPALTNALRSANRGIRQCAAHGLGDFGDKAKAAVPALVRTLDDPWPKARLFATNALQKISPEVLSQSAVR